jgi:lysophospholipase L1-like esterase
MKRLVIRGVLVAAAGLSLALLASPAARQTLAGAIWNDPNAADEAALRLPSINRQLAEAPRDFILLAGDSHAVRLHDEALCGRPVVNAGSNGANAKVYARLAGKLKFAAAPEAIVLVVGTNDLPSKNKPSREAELRRRAAQARAIVDYLSRQGSRLVMTAIPPFAASAIDRLDLAALLGLSRELEQICRATPGCLFTDLFAEARSERFGIGRPGGLADELHLADYRPARRQIEALLCPADRALAEQRR